MSDSQETAIIEKVSKRKITLSNRDEALNDYRLAVRSRHASLIGRREVISGKAKFGIFGDGKELAQVVLAKFFRPGDFRSGYYRDQTLVFSLEDHYLQEFFSQLYAHADPEIEPMTAGRAMNAHFATRSLNSDGSWKDLAEQYNIAADVSPTGSQMPRLVGLAYASRLYRELPELQSLTQFSHHGDEIAFGMVGNATCAEGMFWESVNAIGVLQSPAVISIWDDGYGISVTNEYQITTGDLSRLLKGFQRQSGTKTGFEIYRARGWNYSELIETYQKATEVTRREHVPSIIHVVEMTQPQGHSTSGSHERYKSKQRLDWEQEFDCIRKFGEWIVDQNLATQDELQKIDEEERRRVESVRETAWKAYLAPILEERQQAANLIERLAENSVHQKELQDIRGKLVAIPSPLRRDIMTATRSALIAVKDEDTPARKALIAWKREQQATNSQRYDSHLYNQGSHSALNVPETKPSYSDSSPTLMGFEVVNACFDAALARDPRVIAFGEDVGRLGDVNQGFKGLQAKYGELRVSDTGIRETTIAGQAIGMAMRGLRPIAEIQYLDYLLYAIQILSDDLATLQWRTAGGQMAPAIIRTRGHRLEGIWHSGSLMAGIIHLLRGMYVCVPRNMTQAAGMYNTLLQSDDPALVVEVLNGYRLKERLPDNIGDFTVPLGVPEVLRQGSDATLVTYGAMCRIALEAAEQLKQLDIELEVIDVQTLLPFDLNGVILESLKKTSRIIFADEDVPGGTTAYMLQEALEKQGGYYWLDSEPRTITGKAHRPSYGSDGDYWSKPSVETIIESVYQIMQEVDPEKYPSIF